MARKDKNGLTSERGAFPSSGSVYDPLIRAPYPWRRIFARVLDYFIYLVFWLVIMYLFPSIPIASERSNIHSATLLTMIFLEPLLLLFLGTTAGNAVLGLRVESVKGRNLNYFEGIKRFFLFLLYVMLLMVVSAFDNVSLVFGRKGSDRREVRRWDAGVCYKVKRHWSQALWWLVGALLCIYLCNELCIAIFGKEI